MARSRGQIRQLAKNRYLARIYLGRIDGKRKYKSKVVHRDKEAAEKRHSPASAYSRGYRPYRSQPESHQTMKDSMRNKLRNDMNRLILERLEL